MYTWNGVNYYTLEAVVSQIRQNQISKTPITYYLLPITYYPLPITDSRFPIPDSRFPISYYLKK
ncbi:hypothetical protein BJP36_16695 [Moorena producens JHB]|uniref:Uncharacterized protein n=1 Tax=Moorena producens (strain JHB) TaxID=1454205 RepID=A0A1D9G102_MOOP1|nr:hypothetical protein [Moorena producens]AOY81296.1 hypothetical protein BJP36_16695 [Moorena producens JHB]